MQQVWHEYVLTMRASGYNTRTPLYVACGLLSYGAADEWQETQNILLHRGIARSLHYKEEFLPEADLKGGLSALNRGGHFTLLRTHCHGGKRQPAVIFSAFDLHLRSECCCASSPVPTRWCRLHWMRPLNLLC